MTRIEHTSSATDIVDEGAYAQLSELYRWQDTSGRDITGKISHSEDDFVLSPHCEWNTPAFCLRIGKQEQVSHAISFFAYKLGRDVQVCQIKEGAVAAEQLPDEGLSMIARVLPAAMTRLQEIRQNQPAKRSFWRRWLR